MSHHKFKELLDQSHNWPEYYEFKFIVKVEDKGQVLAHLEGFSISENLSGKGNYVSISARKLMQSPDEIIQVYETIGRIKGVMSL